jgi:hypothetical protein
MMSTVAAATAPAAKPAANKPEDKPVDIVREFITTLATDPWVDASVKRAAQAALRRYEPKQTKAEPAKEKPAQ